MASRNSGNSTSESSRSGRCNSQYGGSSSVVLCYHDERAPLRVVRAEGPTKGRRFMSAPTGLTCGFFKWADVVDQVSDLQHMLFVKDATIAELEGQNYVLRDKLRKMRIKRSDLQDEVDEMGLATTETMYELKSHISDKKLFVLTFIFFALVLFLK